MYFRIGIICSAALASGSSFIGFRHSELPTEVRRLELSLSSVADLKQFTRDIDSSVDGMYLGRLGRFLKTAENVRWIYAQHARITSEEVRKAFDTLVTILQNVRSTNYFDNQCSPPLGEYIEKDLSPEEIRFVADLYSLDDQSIEQDMDKLSRVTDYTKMFRPIVNLFKTKLEREPMYAGMARYSCFDRNILRRAATLRTLNAEEFVDLLGTPAGLLLDIEIVGQVLMRHFDQIRESFGDDLRGLMIGLGDFENSRSYHSRDKLGRLVGFVWYFVPVDLCRTLASQLGAINTPEAFDVWRAALVTRTEFYTTSWVAICALNGDRWYIAREPRSRLFSHRSQIVQAAIDYMDEDYHSSFQAQRAELLLSPTSSSDADILKVPALFGRAYRRDFYANDQVVPNYPKIALGYLVEARNMNAYQLKRLWLDLLNQAFYNCQDTETVNCWDFVESLTLNPFTLVSAIHGTSCEMLADPKLAINLFGSVERCEELERMDPVFLISTLITEIRESRSTADSIRAGFDEALRLKRQQNP